MAARLANLKCRRSKSYFSEALQPRKWGGAALEKITSFQEFNKIKDVGLVISGERDRLFPGRGRPSIIIKKLAVAARNERPRPTA